MNEFCVAKLIKRLSLFVSRNAMNIDGLSDAILTKFIDEGIIKEYADLYHLSEQREKIISFEGFGDKSYENLYKSIEKSRKVKLANFIYALGINDIGLSRAKLICNSFNLSQLQSLRLLVNSTKTLETAVIQNSLRYISNFMHAMPNRRYFLENSRSLFLSR